MVAPGGRAPPAPAARRSARGCAARSWPTSRTPRRSSRPLPGVLDVAVEVGQRRQAETPLPDDPRVLLEIVPPHLVVRAALETPAPIAIALGRTGAPEERHG